MIGYDDFVHLPWAIGIQLAGVGLFALGERVRAIHWWICGLGGFAAMFAREVTQAEYRYIEAHGGHRAAMPDLIGFDVFAWNRHSIAETLVAAAGVVIVASVGSRWTR